MLATATFIAGLVINFVMNMTVFAIPMLLGGARNMVASMLAFQINLVSLDWPLGGALAAALVVFTLALVWLGQRGAALLMTYRGVRP